MSESVSPPNGEKQTVRTQRPPFPIAVLAGSLAITAAVVAAAVLAAPSGFRIPLAVGASAAALLLSATLTLTAHYRARLGQIRQEVLAHRMQAEAQVNTTVSTAQVRIAESENRIADLREQVAEQARTVKEIEHRRAAALAAFAGAAGRMQAMSTSMLAELREMEHRHADPKVLADLLELDHRTAQAGRLADSIAVLSGARSGRRWAKPIAMESILRGAMGRVAGYQRVRLRAVTEIAIAGHAAEGIMHALAELLDNACNFSPPTTEVHVYAAEVPAGVVLTIEDSGLVMSESALRRAESAVSRTRTDSDLSSLSGTRLGLAVVGHLARKHDLTVSYRPSAIGGTAVVVVVPRELITRLDRQSGTLSRLTPVTTTGDHPVYQQPSEAASPGHPGVLVAGISTTAVDSGQEHAGLTAGNTGKTAGNTGTPPADTRMANVEALMRAAEAGTAATAKAHTATAEAAETDSRPETSSGLPKRRRGTTLAAVHPDGLAPPHPGGRASRPGGPADPPRPPSSPSAMGAFQRAVTGRGDAGTPPPATLTNLGSGKRPEPDGSEPGPLTSSILAAIRRGGEGGLTPSLRDAVPQIELPPERTPAPDPFPAPTTSRETDR